MKTYIHPNWTIISLTPTWYDPIEWDTYTITSEVIKQLWFLEDKQEDWIEKALDDIFALQWVYDVRQRIKQVILKSLPK